MVAVIQRVSQASVEIEVKVHSAIKEGLLILIGIKPEDTSEDLKWIIHKVVNMRIFGDESQKMNLSVKDISGEILVVSQFTLLANCKKGNRPSFIEAAKPDIAISLYNLFLAQLQEQVSTKVQSGIFGADMKVNLTNDGPVTIILDSLLK